MKTVQSSFDLNNNSLKKPKYKLTPIGGGKYKQKDFLKCPFNYIGGKHKILPQLFTAFPKNNNIFVDMFGGGFNVGINSSASKIIYNDQLTPLVDLFKYLQDNSCNDIINYIETTIEENNLKKHEKEGSASGYRHVYDRPCQAGQEPACQYGNLNEDLRSSGL